MIEYDEFKPCIKCGQSLKIIREQAGVLKVYGDLSCDLCDSIVKAVVNLEKQGLKKWLKLRVGL